ncbi:CDP-glycerol--glycerophosphate glycerophosphotransferase [Paraprevotella clara]|uniref:CDP-glycerol:poly(Glycerophosphate) glycerophosphotransferase n=1 Tax=Paraprevotella clara YIT 11840 TaxID=762968 RepID=G5SM23_9BACT|nr:CDP-glycerol--glycerophosphate glycerophosphotransferase [Paraprevotella clara]EHH01581.1 CDP-glycerol:poly(glycerophosphate) glycerophosphotransferase [Paraprevotella clara YIT 11840]
MPLKHLDYYGKWLLTNLIKVLFIIPIKKRTILFISFNGKQYSCNPKYISEHIESSPSFNGTTIVWAFQNPQQFEFLTERGIKTIKNRSLQYIYYRLVCSAYITNMGEMPTLPTRKSQLYINTWHGGGCYKRCGLQNASKEHDKFYVMKMKNSFARATHFLSSCNAFSKKVIKESFLFQKDIIEAGLPRNDIFFKDQSGIKEKVYKHFQLDADVRLCLYAPTYREIGKLYDSKLAFEQLTQCLSKRFGGLWKVLYRSHQFLDEKEVKHHVISASNYPDMQELISASSILITDYSSCLWDAMLAKDKIFLYVPDLDDYKNKRDFYVPIKEWGLSISKNNKELAENIENFNQKAYDLSIKKHLETLGSFENGHATEEVCKIIVEHFK